MDTFNQQKLAVPLIGGKIQANLEITLKEYDKIVFNHIKSHYYDGHMTQSDQDELKELMEITKQQLYYQDNSSASSGSASSGSASSASSSSSASSTSSASSASSSSRGSTESK